MQFRGLQVLKNPIIKKKIMNDVIRQQFRLLNSGDGGAYNINCDWWRIIGFFYLLCLGYEDRVRRTATTVEERRPKKKNEEPVWKYNTVAEKKINHNKIYYYYYYLII